MWAIPHDTANLVTFTEGSFNEKLNFCVVLYFIKKYLKHFKSQALVDLKGVFPISPKRYIYNYHESYHDTVIVSVTLHVTKLHITSFMRVSACCFLTGQNLSESKCNDVTDSLKKWQSLVIPCNPMAILAFPVSLYDFRFIWKQCSHITYFCRLAVSFRYFESR